MESLRRPSSKPTVHFPAFVAVLCTGIAVVLTTNAQPAQPAQSATVPVSSTSVSPSTILGSTTLGAALVSMTEILAGPPVSTTEVPASNAFQPTTPWPVTATVSQTVLQSPHDLLTYTGVESAVRNMVGADFDNWSKHFSSSTGETAILKDSGLLMSSGCEKPCDTQKSLLIVDPESRKVYAAMVTPGKVAMWPSLMSWPDEAIPALKRWLAAATDDKQD
jgi:hypothetical protein